MNTYMIRATEMALADDGRTIEGRIVPYNEPTEIVELRDGEVKRYTEMFLPRSCARMAQAAARRSNASFISFVLDHSESFDNRIGHCSMLEERADGAHATFRLYQSRDLEKVQSILRESHDGLSVYFADIKPPRVEDGVTKRVQVHISHVAATPTPAYDNARIMAMRNDVEPVDDGTPNLDEVMAFLESIRKVDA